MIRTQISLTVEQADALRRLAAERSTSMAALLRDAVDEVVAEAEDDRRWQRALSASGRFHSCTAGTSERHDDALDAIYGDDLPGAGAKPA